ncbi:hypothetical protein BTH160X_50393 [Brochothrix thermosphacta]|nr:hypothetical protein BTH160X_50393 [Brochothrix thermosphacta]
MSVSFSQCYQVLIIFIKTVMSLVTDLNKETISRLRPQIIYLGFFIIHKY